MDQLPTTARRLSRSTRAFLERFISAIRQDDLGGTAAQMTYYFMLALFPTLILAIWVLDLLPLPGDMSQFIGRAFSNISSELGGLIQSYLEDFAKRRPSGSILMWAFAALWAASRGVGGARKGLNRVFKSKRRSHFAKLRLIDLAITLGGIIFVGLANALLLSGRHFAGYLCNIFGWEESYGIAWSFIYWPLTILLLLGGVILAYRVLPSRKLEFRFLFYGAVPTVLGWLFLAGSFRLWLRSMGDFDKLYGSLASFFLLMVFLWMVSLCLLIGGQTAALMAEEESSEKPKAGHETVA